MSVTELETRIVKMQEWEQLAQDAAAEAEAIRDTIKAEMLARDTDELTIRYADGTEKQHIYRRKEDMATELMAMFQEELRVYPPWSEDRRKQYEY